MLSTSKDLPDSKPKWVKVNKTTLHDLINDGSVEDSLGDGCVEKGGNCSKDSDCCKHKLLLYEAPRDSLFLSCQSSLYDYNTSSFQAAIGAIVCV